MFLAVLALVVVSNLFAVVALTRRSVTPPDPFDLATSPTVLRVLAGLAAVNVAAAVALWCRHRWGFFAFVASAAPAACINVIVIGNALGLLGLALIPLLFVTLRKVGPSGAEWDRLDSSITPNRTWSIIGVVAVATVIALPLAWNASTRGSGGALAVSEDGDALNGFVVLMEPDGSERRQVTGPGSGARMVESRPLEWSLDGSTLLFDGLQYLDRRSEARDLFAVDADGGNITKLTDGEFGGSASWSPDGTRILLEHDDDLVIIEADEGIGGDRTVTVADGDEAEGQGVRAGGWTPDGSHVHYVADRKLFVVGIDSDRPPQRIGDESILVSRAELSPDGGRFAVGGDGELVVFVVGRDGSDQQRLTGVDVDNTFVGWASGGSQLIVNRRDEDDVADIYAISADGSVEKRLTDDDALHFAGAVSPDGDQVAYSRTDASAGPSGSAAFTDAREVWLMNIDGSDKRQITSNDVGEFPRAWGRAD